MRVPEGDLHCQCKLSIFSLSSFGPCIVFWILQKGTCIGKCIFSIFPAVTHQLKCKQTCIEKCRPRHKISMKKWLKIHQISKNVNLFPYITTNLHCPVLIIDSIRKKSNSTYNRTSTYNRNLRVYSYITNIAILLMTITEVQGFLNFICTFRTFFSRFC